MVENYEKAEKDYMDGMKYKDNYQYCKELEEALCLE